MQALRRDMAAPRIVRQANIVKTDIVGRPNRLLTSTA